MIWIGCPTCGGAVSVAAKGRKGRALVGRRRSGYRRDQFPERPIRVYWPIKQYRQPTRVCPDPYHGPHPKFPVPGWWSHRPPNVVDEQEHVALLPHEGSVPLRPEARERAAVTRRRNRQRQGKASR